MNFEYFILAFILSFVFFLYLSPTIDYFRFKKELTRLEFKTHKEIDNEKSYEKRMAIASRFIPKAYALKKSKLGIFDKLYYLIFK